VSSAIKRVGVAITGASGVIYGIRLVEVLARGDVNPSDFELIVTISKGARKVASYELGENIDSLLEKHVTSSNKHGDIIVHKMKIYEEDDFSSPLASSSSAPDVMAVVPCSIKTLSEIAYGQASNIIVRGALSMLRLGRKLVLVPRETPLGLTELELMLSLAKRGAYIVPAMPGFYHNPRRLEDLIDFVVGKVLDLLGFEHGLYKRWGNG